MSAEGVSRRWPAEVWEPDSEPLRAIYGQIPETVGVPGVHLLWRVLATVPAFLIGAWPAIAVNLSEQRAINGARDLQQAAFIVEAVGLPSHKAFRGDLVRAEIDADFRTKIEAFNALSRTGLSRLLITAAALNVAGEDGISGDAAGETTGHPVGIMPGAVYVPPLREGEAIGKARDLLARIEREHGLPCLDDYYRSLARIAEYASAAWNAIRPIVGDPVYLERAAQLTRSATALARELPASAAAGSALAELDRGASASVRRVLSVFVEQVLPQTLIDVTLITALTSGPERALAPA